MTKQPSGATRLIVAHLHTLEVGEYAVFDLHHAPRIRAILAALLACKLKLDPAMDLWPRAFKQRRVQFAGITVVGRLR